MVKCICLHNLNTGFLMIGLIITAEKGITVMDTSNLQTLDLGRVSLLTEKL